MSPKSRGRPPGRGRPQAKGPARPPSPAELVIRDARFVVEECDDALSAELWAGEVLGDAWLEAPDRDDEAEQRLVAEVAEVATRKPSLYGTAAVAALRRIADEPGRAALDAALETLRQSRPLPTWANDPDWTPVAAWRSMDVWGSERLLFVDFDGPQPHCLLAVISETPARWITELEILEPGSAPEFDEREPGEAEMLLPVEAREIPETLADLADALRGTDALWPREDDPDYVELRGLAWARARAHLAPENEREPMPETEKQALVDEFVAGSAMPDADLTRALAELLVDFGDSFLPDGPLSWSPSAVEFFLVDWLPQTVELEQDEREGMPEALRHWVEFTLTRRGVEPRWVVPVQAAIVEHLAAYEEALDNQPDWDPVEMVAAELVARGVDLADEDAVAEGLRQLEAEGLAAEQQT